MPNVVTPFIRKRDRLATSDPASARHRRDGYFDEQDFWHDAEPESVDAAEVARS